MTPAAAAPKAQRAAAVAAGRTVHSAAAYDGGKSSNGVQNGLTAADAADVAGAQVQPGRLFTFGICTDVQYADLREVTSRCCWICKRAAWVPGRPSTTTNNGHITPRIRMWKSDRLPACEASCVRHNSTSRTAAQRVTTGTAWTAENYHVTEIACPPLQGKSHGGTARYYRDSLDGLRRAVHGWQERCVDFGMHLGDVVDGYAHMS